MAKKVRIPDILANVLDFRKHPYGSVRYRGAYGGRGSGKTRTFATAVAIFAAGLAANGVSGSIICAREFQNSIQDSSFLELKQAIQAEPELAAHFDIGDRFIRTADRRINFIFIGLRHNLESIKSKAKVLLVWVDEAEPVSEKAWEYLIPTVREDGSEIWITWNPLDPESATNERFRKNPPADSLIVECNYTDNPWFPSVLEAERRSHFERFPRTYHHVWEGGYREFSDDALFREEWLGEYIHTPVTLSSGYLRIDTAQKGEKTSDFHGLVAMGYDKRDPLHMYVLDAQRKQCEFPDLADWVVEYAQHLKEFESQTFSFSRITIEDANVGAALQSMLRTKLREAGIKVNVQLTPRYGSKFDRALEAVNWFEQGRVLFPKGVTGWQKDKGEGLKALRKEYLSFTETDTHASDDLLDPLIWEVVSRFGNGDPNGSGRYWRGSLG